MQFLDFLFEVSKDLVPLGLTILGVLGVLVAAHYVLNRRFGGALDFRFRFQLFMLVITLLGFLVILLALPISEVTKGQLLGLIGILMSGVIALSATTFVGNAMAGFMLRIMRNFRPGDFICVEDHFGRVSGMELFHVELQTESRDLTTLPNLYLVTNPVKVIRSSGTLVTAEISLGYDVSHSRVTALLKEAATEAGLQDPFVHITNLGNFAISYKVSGLLTEVKGLLTMRSRLKQEILDQLHSSGIEIVSPHFMNQRILPLDERFIPPVTEDELESAASPTIESIAFDKADEAESVEKLRQRYRKLEEELQQMQKKAEEKDSGEERTALNKESESLRSQMERLAQYISQREEKSED